MQSRRPRDLKPPLPGYTRDKYPLGCSACPPNSDLGFILMAGGWLLHAVVNLAFAVLNAESAGISPAASVDSRC